jgi:2-polyprenyl-6-methoxyphenol hydroxylase-like FAD-dependent oxidoreductase
MAEAGRILITGGGIAGLSLAIALRRCGYTPELAEQCPQWPAAGAGIALYANAVRALRALGLGDAVSRAAAPLPCYGYMRHDTALNSQIRTSPARRNERDWPRRPAPCPVPGPPPTPRRSGPGARR